MSQPEQIIRVLDSHLTQPARLIIYGRAALALGYPCPLPAFHSTMDVDAILPEVEMSSIEADDSFWTGIENTNHELLSSGLYVTHLFADSQVILRPDWLDHIVSIPLEGLQFLSLFRPSTEDLILTKMMRIDPQDRGDIDFLLQNSRIDALSLTPLLESAKVPDIPEIREAFAQNSTWLKNHMLNS